MVMMVTIKIIDVIIFPNISLDDVSNEIRLIFLEDIIYLTKIVFVHINTIRTGKRYEKV